MPFHRAFSAFLSLLAAALLWTTAAHAQGPVRVIAAGGPYDPVTLELTGPMLDEASGPNPFADYRLDVTFSDGRGRWTVPGYFAGCPDAADRPCTGGRTWRAHFVPHHGGAWTWQVRFRAGPDIVVTSARGSALPGDGASGRFTVGAAPRNAVRARGVLRYTGETYYRWSGDDSVSFKFGPDAPENMLAYAGFDATPNYKSFRKDWAPHLRDYDAPTGDRYLWRGGEGKALLGMFNYLHQSGLNVVSMLLFNVGGDDRNVVPQLLKVDPETYIAITDPQRQWDEGVVHDRYDVSKLAQWQRALSYADELGLRLHFKLQENEGDRLMDGGRLGRERRIYVREMMARFNHFLAVTWNLGEESFQATGDVRDMAAYVASLDPYRHPLVLHTYPHQKERYRPLLGHGSALNGLSLQGGTLDFSDLRGDVTKWSTAARLSGRALVMGYDEAGSANVGAPVDAAYPAGQLPEPIRRNGSTDVFRRMATWNALTAGSEGIEAYYGYQTGCTDLNCQDHRTRAALYADGVRAIRFFERHVGTRALAMQAIDDLTPDKADFVFADPGRLYVIYTASAAAPRLSLFSHTGRYRIRWFDPVAGGPLRDGSVTEINAVDDFTPNGLLVGLGNPPAGGGSEWVVLVERIGS